MRKDTIRVKLKKAAAKLNREIPALYMALKDNRTPLTAKLLAFFAVAYALSPIDLIPDFIPIIGYLDDLLLLPMLVGLTVRFIPREVYAEALETSADLWENGKPKKWYYTLPIIIVWVIVIYVAVKAVFFCD
ncbi:MAG: DUF1232 domain-containing protein [Eubacteriales bacterium]|nr:DUF1232 domain-containing protein [Eubacteriales bacterium]